MKRRMAERVRASARPGVACEALEGRSLLSAGGFRPFGMVGPPVDLGGWAGHRVGFDHVNAGAGHRGGRGAGIGFPQDATTKADLQKLRTDEEAIRAKSQVTPAMRDALRQDFQQVFQQGGRPDAQAVQTLRSDLADLAKSGTAPTDAQKARVQADFQAVLQSTKAPQGVIDKTVADSQAIQAASNVSADDLATLAADRAAIQADFTRLGLKPTGDGTGHLGGLPGGPDSGPFGEAFGPFGGGFGGGHGPRGPGLGWK